jgi:hypothetical protein
VLERDGNHDIPMRLLFYGYQNLGFGNVFLVVAKACGMWIESIMPNFNFIFSLLKILCFSLNDDVDINGTSSLVFPSLTA